MQRPASLFSDVIDQHFTWFTVWHRLAFFPEGARSVALGKLLPPVHVSLPFDQYPNLLRDQPAIEKLTLVYEQLHTLARLALVKTPDGEAINRQDYDSVIAKHQEFLSALRRIERAFQSASSGLDSLTGMRNRNGLYDDFAREHGRFLRTGKKFCIAMMDIDHFKKINDTYGHETGDKVLAAVADHLGKSLRVFDDVYRVGGEEFLIGLKETDCIAGQAVLERVRSGLAETPVILADGEVIRVTASFGFTEVTDNPDIEAQIARSDQALYRAKKEGRNCVVLG